MRRNRRPTLVTSAVLTLITVFFWAGFEVYRSLTVKPVPPVPANILLPLDPTLDTASLNAIQNRTFLTDDQIGNFTASNAATIISTPAPTVIPSASPSAIPTASPSATLTPSPTP